MSLQQTGFRQSFTRRFLRPLPIASWLPPRSANQRPRARWPAEAACSRAARMSLRAAAAMPSGTSGASDSTYFGEGAWPERVDERTTEEPERWVPVGVRALLQRLRAGHRRQGRAGSSASAGRADDRVNRGRLGPKGLHGWEANDSPDRLTRPLVRRGGTLARGELGRGDGPDRRAVEGDPRAIHRRRRSASTRRGQLFLEEYYTLGRDRQGRASARRTWTATPGSARRPPRAALKETFGADGQPGSYTDLDTTDAILHRRPQRRLAADRPLDRASSTAVAGPNPPKLVVIDPRTTDDGQGGRRPPRAPGRHERRRPERPAAPDHRGRPDRPRLTSTRTPSASTTLRGDGRAVAARARRGGRRASPRRPLRRGGRDPRRGADRWSRRSSRASTSRCRRRPRPCQVNNLHLIRGHDRQAGLRHPPDERPADRRRTPASAAPTATCPAFRNWDNPEHIAELARLWNVEPAIIPHWAPPTHAMQIFRYAETGSIKLLWISATNPAVSLPELHRIRKILAKPGLFVVVQDAFLTETAAAGRRRPAGGDLGREDRLLHQRRPHRPHLRTRPSSRPARRGRTSTSSSTTPGGWTSATRTARPLIKWSDARGGLRGLEGMHARAAPATTPA